MRFIFHTWRTYDLTIISNKQVFIDHPSASWSCKFTAYWRTEWNHSGLPYLGVWGLQIWLITGPNLTLKALTSSGCDWKCPPFESRRCSEMCRGHVLPPCISEGLLSETLPVISHGFHYLWISDRGCLGMDPHGYWGPTELSPYALTWLEIFLSEWKRNIWKNNLEYSWLDSEITQPLRLPYFTTDL